VSLERQQVSTLSGKFHFQNLFGTNRAVSVKRILMDEYSVDL